MKFPSLTRQRGLEPEEVLTAGHTNMLSHNDASVYIPKSVCTSKDALFAVFGTPAFSFSCSCLIDTHSHTASQCSPHISEYQMMCSPDGSPTRAHSASCWRQNCQRISPQRSGLWAWRVKDWKQMQQSERIWKNTPSSNWCPVTRNSAKPI